MYLSKYFLPILKENPSEAKIASHRLMLRSGMIKQSSAGIYSWLPLGLKVLKNKIKLVKKDRNYFEKKYFFPEINIMLAKKLFLFANCSIDVSDGLIDDLEKLINKQSLSYKLNLNNIPISKNLEKIIKTKKLNVFKNI